MKKEKSIQVDIEVENNNNNPSGLNPQDTMQDAIKRADKLALPNGSSHSGMMCSNKDLRRIVLLVKEHRNLQTQLDKALEAMRDASDMLPERQDNGFDNDVYCKACRRSETFCQCQGFNQAIDKMTESMRKGEL